MARNVVLIVLDTVRKDYFDEYAAGLSSLSGTSFENCVTASSWSTPSHASMLTGDLPHEHGVHTRSQSFGKLSPDDTFLGAIDSYRRVCVTDHKLLSSHYAFDKFFDEHYPAGLSAVLDSVSDADGFRKYLALLLGALTVDDPYSATRIVRDGIQTKFHEQLLPYPSLKLRDDGAAELAEIATAVADDDGAPLFMFMNFLDAHSPYHVLRQFQSELHSAPDSWSDGSLSVWEARDDETVDDEYRSNYRGLYAAAVAYLDSVVSEMVSDIREGTANETTVVVTADHGHNLGYPSEDGLFGHESSMSEGVLHVPLEVINPPDRFPATVTERFSHLHLGALIERIASDDPTVEDLLGGPTPVEVVGHPGGKSRRGEFPGTDSEWRYWDRMIRVVYEGDYKYEWDSTGDSFTYRVDPETPCDQEQVSIGDAPPASVTDLFDTTVDEYKRRVDSLHLDSDAKSHLRNLGYL